MSIEKRYQKLTDIEHVLLRPGMYIGSIKLITEDVYLPLSDKFEQTEITYNPGLLKIVDEIISNSIDEHKRNPKLNVLRVNVTDTTCTIWDNGGIPVEKHKVYDQWVPELIFSNLKTGSNFDDSEQRVVVGTNGVGSTLTNIFSKKFIVSTCDGKNEFYQIYNDNMGSRTQPKISKSKNNHTLIEFEPDFSRFGVSCFDDAHKLLIKKKLYDIAACNSKLKIYYNDTHIDVFSFKNYVELYAPVISYESNRTSTWDVGVCMSNAGFKAISFVNSVETKDGGTHVNYITNQIINYLRERFKKKHRVDIKPNDLKQHIMLFINSTVINPIFSSQTKEKLITEQREFGTQIELSEKFLKQIFESDITQTVLDWISRKDQAEERARLRKLNSNLDKTKVLKLIDAKKTGSRDMCTFGIFEGDSSISAFRRYRDPEVQGAFPIRGKFINVRELSDTKVAQNKEAQNIMAALGLKLGHEPKQMRYGKILIYCDSDVDGQAIAGLLMNFFAKYWPSLFKEQRICKVETPLMVAKKGKKIECFYTEHEFDAWSKQQKNLTDWDIEYKKGLAALENDEYAEIIKNPNLTCFTMDELFEDSFEDWFGSDSQPRKDRILGCKIEQKNNKSLF